MGEVIHHPTDYSSVSTKCSSVPFREMNSQRRACFAQPEIDTGLCALTQAVMGAIKRNLKRAYRVRISSSFARALMLKLPS